MGAIPVSLNLTEMSVERYFGAIVTHISVRSKPARPITHV